MCNTEPQREWGDKTNKQTTLPISTVNYIVLLLLISTGRKVSSFLRKQSFPIQFKYTNEDLMHSSNQVTFRRFSVMPFSPLQRILHLCKSLTSFERRAGRLNSPPKLCHLQTFSFALHPLASLSSKSCGGCLARTVIYSWHCNLLAGTAQLSLIGVIVTLWVTDSQSG